MIAAASFCTAVQQGQRRLKWNAIIYEEVFRPNFETMQNVIDFNLKFFKERRDASKRSNSLQRFGH